MMCMMVWDESVRPTHGLILSDTTVICFFC